MKLICLNKREIRGVYFAHKHSEACEESVYVEAALKKYERQTKRESFRHEVIVSFMLDELKVSTKLHSEIEVIEGYRVQELKKYYPDIMLRIGNEKLAISIITNVNESKDSSLAKEIAKRKSYFIENQFRSIWFIERKNMALETDKNGIILWGSEFESAIKTDEDKLWEELLDSATNVEEFIRLSNYPFSNGLDKFEIKSIYYLSPEKEGNTIQVFRILQDRTTKPIRAHYLFEPYPITIAQALSIQEKTIQLSKPHIEETKRDEFVSNLIEKRLKHEEELRELRIREREIEEERRAERERMAVARKKAFKNRMSKTSPESRLDKIMRTYGENN